jgi:hypothetical protein
MHVTFNNENLKTEEEAHGTMLGTSISCNKYYGFIYITLNNSVHTSVKRYLHLITKIIKLILFTEITTVYCGNYNKPINKQRTNCRECDVKTDGTDSSHCALQEQLATF